MPAVMIETSLTGSTLEVLKRLGNPFRNYFARNPDDEVCAVVRSGSIGTTWWK